MLFKHNSPNVFRLSLPAAQEPPPMHSALPVCYDQLGDVRRHLLPRTVSRKPAKSLLFFFKEERFPGWNNRLSLVTGGRTWLVTSKVTRENGLVQVMTTADLAAAMGSLLLLH